MSKYREVYITITDFAVLQDMGQLYEGFVIGLGYAFRYSSFVNLPDFNGYSHVGDVPPQMNYFRLIKHQCVDNSPDLIERSINGVTSTGAKIYIVRQGDTLTTIAQEHRVSADNLIKWNKISNPDQLEIGQKLIVSESSRDLLGDYLKQNPNTQKNISGTSDINAAIPKISTQQIADLVSICASLHGYLPKTQFYNQAYENGRFVFKKNGGYASYKVGYYGNSSQTASEISRYKYEFNRALRVNKGISGVGTGLDFISVTGNMYDIQSGNVHSNSYGDLGVGSLGLMSSAANYFCGTQIPFVGEFVLLYGTMRTAWDLGVQYGPSRWPGFYRQYQERRREQEFLKAIEKELYENK